jgi:hypothetical protein
VRALKTSIILASALSLSLLACAAPSADEPETLGTDRSALDSPGGGSGSGGTTLPPIPPRPPTPTANAAGHYEIGTARLELEIAAQLTLNKIKSEMAARGLSVTVELVDHPFTCGYQCEDIPAMLFTQYTNNPNDWYANWWGNLHFVAHAYGVKRDIYVTVPYQLFCKGWQNAGGGTMAGYRQATEIVVEGSGYLEEILDFLLGPVNLTRWIDEQFAIAVSGAGGTRTTINLGTNTRCSSLGTINHYPTDDLAVSDSVHWDVPAAGSGTVIGKAVFTP